MGILKALGRGFRVDTLRFAGLIYLVNVSGGLVLYAGLFLLLRFSPELAHRIPETGFTEPPILMILEWIRTHPEGMGQVATLAATVALFYMLSTLFLSGGVYAVLLAGGKKTLRDVFLQAVIQFPRMASITLGILVLGGAVIGLEGALLITILKVFASSGNGSLAIVLLTIWVLSCVFVLFWIIAVYDIGRVLRIQTEKNTFVALWRALGFVVKNKVPFFALFTLFLLIMALMHFLLSLLPSPSISLLTGIAVVLVHQVFILLKYFVKIAVMRVETALVETAIQPPAVPPGGSPS